MGIMIITLQAQALLHQKTTDLPPPAPSEESKFSDLSLSVGPTVGSPMSSESSSSVLNSRRA